MTTAIVMAGAGARGAYEAGVLSAIAPLIPASEPLILIGTSAGAVNAALLGGNYPQGLVAAANATATLWSGLTIDKVMKLSALDLGELVLQFAGALPPLAHGARSLFDTTPLKETVNASWDTFGGVKTTGNLKGIALVATESVSSKSTVFVQGPASLPEDRPARSLYYKKAQLAPQHVLASSAIPIAFPNVEIPGQGWFTDGGVRLNTPIVPALDLGADHVIIIATHPDPSVTVQAPPPPTTQPTVMDEAASIFNALLVDRIAEDVRNLRRVNATLQAAGKQSVQRIDSSGQRSDTTVIPHAYFGPRAADAIPNAARAAFAPYKLLKRLSTLGIIGAALGKEGPSRDELLSFLLFDENYLGALVALGKQDAQAAMEQAGGKIPYVTT